MTGANDGLSGVAQGRQRRQRGRRGVADSEEWTNVPLSSPVVVGRCRMAARRGDKSAKAALAKYDKAQADKPNPDDAA